MLIPEVTIYNFLKAIVQITNDDYNNASDVNNSLLGLMFKTDDEGNEIKIETFNFFEQSVGLFIKNAGNVRKLSINIGYNLNHLTTPTIHVMLPSESPGSFEGIGRGEGYVEESYEEATGLSSKTHTNVYQASYYLVITSDNMSEVLLVYNWLKTMFEIYSDELELMGLRMGETSGGDIQFDASLAPPNIFHRNFILSCQYESSAKRLFDGNKATQLSTKVCDNFSLDNSNAEDIKGITSA